MKQINLLPITIAICTCTVSCKSQATFGKDQLKLWKTITMNDVRGRIDHLDVNLKEQVVYVAAIGNNTLEVADLRLGKTVFSIKGLDEPQGVGYIPQHEEIFVANGGNGDCYFYNARNFEKTASIHLSSDADDVRYDSSERRIYVGYGAGGIAVIDADSHKQTGDIKLPVHPESFQIDKKLHLLFVNLPDAGMVGVVDLKQMKLIDKWVKDSPLANFPMAIDTVHQRVFVGYRHPATLISFDSKTGKELASTSMTGDADDLYYDDLTGQIIISGGEGNINIFHQDDRNNFRKTANIPTSSGSRTSLFIPQLRLFVLASRAGSGNKASLQIYQFGLQQRPGIPQ